MRAARGFSLVELMVALTIGMILVLALTVVIARSSASQRELALANRQVESGRYAIQKLTDEVHNAGFFGMLASVPDPSALPTICGTTVASYEGSLNPGVFVFSPSDAPTGCVVKNAVAGTDVLLVIRADAKVANWPSLDTASKNALPTGLYVQTNGQAVMVKTDPTALTLTQRVCPLSGSTRPWCQDVAKVTADADIRALHVTMFFVSPCNRPISGNYGDACTNADDGRPVPTLKRADLVNGAWVVRPVAEGIENLQIELGLDDVGTPDGAPDTFLAANPSIDQLKNVVAAGVHVLAVNSDALAGQSDTKAYKLGTTDVAAKSDGLKRHVFSRIVRLNNSAGRREP